MDDVKFCLRCGHALEWRDIYGAMRPVCTSCGRVHFFDPKVAVGLLIEQAGRLLLVRRSMNPEMGKWSIPAGFMDRGEDPMRAAERECREETGLEVRVESLFDVLGRAAPTDGADVFIVYRAAITGGQLTAGDDASEVGYFSPDALPELAFVSTQIIINRWRAG